MYRVARLRFAVYSVEQLLSGSYRCERLLASFSFPEMKLDGFRVENHRELGEVRHQRSRRKAKAVAVVVFPETECETESAHQVMPLTVHQLHFLSAPRHISALGCAFYTY